MKPSAKPQIRNGPNPDFIYLEYRYPPEARANPGGPDHKHVPSLMRTQTDLETDFQKWHERRISKTQLYEELRAQELPPDEITSVWDRYARYCTDRRCAQGWLWMFTGGFLGFVSCVLTILDFAPDLRWVFMYGLTTVAISMALYGCYLVMEKPGDLEE